MLQFVEAIKHVWLRLRETYTQRILKLTANILLTACLTGSERETFSLFFYLSLLSVFLFTKCLFSLVLDVTTSSCKTAGSYTFSLFISFLCVARQARGLRTAAIMNFLMASCRFISFCTEEAISFIISKRSCVFNL